VVSSPSTDLVLDLDRQTQASAS